MREIVRKGIAQELGIDTEDENPQPVIIDNSIKITEKLYQGDDDSRAE